jgi:REP element-mobilizing transposase RayT
MPQRRPDYFAGGHYHLYNRGCHRASIFRQPQNYLFVLRRVKQYLGELELSLIAYCLMPNHYHFLVRQEAGQPAGLLVQRVFNSYSKAYNRLYQHTGTLFEGNYRVKPVLQTAHLLQLCRYIHANPVKDGLVAQPGDWLYSNYLEWLGSRPGTLVDRAFVLRHFPTPAEYAGFVQAYLRSPQLPQDVEEYLDVLMR